MDVASIPFTEPVSDPQTLRILDAARTLLSRHGMRRTSMADVVAASGVSKSTLFRRFADRNELISRVIGREVAIYLAETNRIIEQLTDPEDRLVAMVVRFIATARDHRLLRNLIETDPETVLPLLTVEAEPILTFGRTVLLVELHAMIARGHELTGPPDICAELLIRLAHSFMLSPTTATPVNDPAALAALARNMIIPMVVVPVRATTDRQP